MEEKRLKRFWLRAAIILSASGFAGWLLGGLLIHVLPRPISIGMIIAGTVLLLAYIAVMLVFLRCPYCGKTTAKGGWNPGRSAYCPYCGRPFLFDDDPPDKAETTTKEEP